VRISKSWIIASKDFKVFKKKRNIIYLTFVVPLIVGTLFPVLIYYLEHFRVASPSTSPKELTILLPAFQFFFLMLAGVIPTYIASYSIVGEKVEKSLDRLLAAPVTDGEILLGKGISGFLPPMAAILSGSVIFMTLMDLVTEPKLGYYFFPTWNSWIILFLMVPLAVVLSVEWNVIVSSRVSDIRVAQQTGAAVFLPFVAIYVSGEINLINLGVSNNLLIIAGALLVADLILFFAARATFQREEILTRWK
jgi:ABC-2 type transport system permease protein